MKFRYLPHTSVLALAWPMILSNLSQPLLGLVDTAILGHLPSPAYLSAVALGASILSITLWSMGFLRMGTTSLAARAYGRRDEAEQERLLVHSALLALALGLLLVILRTPLTSLALTLMQPSATTAPLAASYCHIRLLSAPLALSNLVIMGWFIGRQNTRVPLLILITTNVLNLLLDMAFIWGLGLNSDGAAWATVCADGLGWLLALALVLRQKPQLWTLFQRHTSLRLEPYRSLFVINRHLFIRTLCLLLTIAFFTSQGAQMGDSILAANAIIFQLLMLTSYGLDGIAHASEAMVGQATGAGDANRTKAVIVTSGFWSALIALCMSLLFAVNPPWLIGLFTDIPAVRDTLSEYYAWVMVLPLASVGAYWLDGVFIGSGRTKTMQNTMLACCFGIFFPLWWLTQSWHNHGLWLAFTVFNLSRGVSLALFSPTLYRNKFKRQKL